MKKKKFDEGKIAARRGSVIPFYHIGWEEEGKYKDIFEMGENLEEIPPDFLSVRKILVENPNPNPKHKRQMWLTSREEDRRGEERRGKERRGE